MAKKNDTRNKIVKVLRKHPEGLTINQIANKVHIHRINVSKYIYGLTGSGVIRQRRVGTAKLCYLNKGR